MIVTTKQGDQGMTTLFGGLKVPKHHALIEVNGHLDELQVMTGLVKTEIKNPKQLAELNGIQQFLYRIMADVAGAKPLLAVDYGQFLASLEDSEKKLISQASISNKFVLPGRSKAEIACQMARAKARQAERLLSRYSRRYPKLKKAIPAVNRLSDYFFVLGESLVK